MKNKIEDLRNHLFETIEMLKNGEIEIEKARAISEVGKVIVDSAKTEVDFMRITRKRYNDFMPEESTSKFLDNEITKEKMIRPPAEYSNNGHSKLIEGT